MLLNDKVAIVTGGGSGIGEATSRRFAREGATVVVADTRLAKAETVASEINDNQGHALAIKVDVSEADSVAALVDATVTHSDASTSCSTTQALCGQALCWSST